MERHDIGSSLVRRDERPAILLSLDSAWGALPRLLDLSRERRWRLLDVRFRYGDLPKGFVPDGALVNQLPTDRLVKKLLKLGCPVVRVGMLPHPKDELVPAVLPDWEAVGERAAQHFAERGFKHFGYIGHHHPLVDRQAAEYAGLEASVAALGCRCYLLELEPPGVTGYGPPYYRKRRAQIGSWLATTPRPLSLFCFVDGFAATVCAMCRDLGIAVPEEVAILGYGDIASASVGSWPTLSTIVPDHEREAVTAVQTLEWLMRGKVLGETTVKIPPSRVIVRESTDILAAADKHVAMALRYMWDHLHLHLSVDDVAREVGVSRRTLERDFRSGLGRSVNVELRRKRLEQLKLLLRTTDTNITDLAPLVGFRSPQYLHRVFRGTFGMSPREYRLRRTD